MDADMVEGFVHTSKVKGDFEIVKYKRSDNVIIKFLDTGYRCKTNKYDIRKGAVRDKLRPSVCGVGYIGDGRFETSYKKTQNKAYQTWASMIKRCYSDKVAKNRPTYGDCIVCDEWHNFQAFAEWFYENAPSDCGYHLDKDTLVKGNKVYSPSTCIFIKGPVNSRVARAKSYRFLNPNGELVEIYSMRDFCMKNGLSDSAMNMVSKGKRSHHKGWTAANDGL